MVGVTRINGDCGCISFGYHMDQLDHLDHMDYRKEIIAIGAKVKDEGNMLRWSPWSHGAQGKY